MESISSTKLAEIVKSASAVATTDITEVVTDSRKANKNSLFIAIKGEKFDGHDFVKEVVDNGCPLAVVSHLLPNVPATRQMVVADTVKAYGQVGAYNRSRLKGKVIGLTGSSGKTTTKEEIKFVLRKFGDVYATPENHNNHIGVPESLCSISSSADFAVIEMGMSAKGEISNLTSYVKPDIAVITNVYPMHIEFFDDLKGIAEAKAEIFESLAPEGIAVINADTNYAELLIQRAEEKKANVRLFGSNNKPQITPLDEGCLVVANIGGKQIEFELPENGEAFVSNALCTLTVIDALGLDITKAASLLRDFGALPGRGQRRRLKLPENKGDYILIDDSYSGQPEAMKLAIQNLSKLPCKGRKIAVLGKMAELGDTSESRHKEIGEAVRQAGIDIVIGVCPETQELLKQLDVGQKSFYFDNKDGLDDFLVNKLLQNNDIVLIKGARYSSKLYQTAESLIKQGE